MAFWAKKVRTKSFSVAKPGFDEGMEMARKARREGCEKALLARHLPLLPDLARSLARVTVPEPGWEVRWSGRCVEAFLDEDYGALDGRGSWWAFIEAIARLKAEEIRQCGHTQVCTRGAWLKKVYIDLIGKEQAR